MIPDSARPSAHKGGGKLRERVTDAGATVDVGRTRARRHTRAGPSTKARAAWRCEYTNTRGQAQARKRGPTGEREGERAKDREGEREKRENRARE